MSIEKTYRDMLSEGVISKINKKDFDNPEVLVKGVGRYNLKTLKKNVAQKFADLTKLAAADRFDRIAALMNQRGGGFDVLMLMLETIERAEVELDTPQMKRKRTMLKQEPPK